MRGSVPGLFIFALLAGNPVVSHAGPQEDFFNALAAMDGATMKRAIDQGASPNFVFKGMTPLLTAVGAGRADMARVLIDLGADVNDSGGASDSQFIPPLSFAAASDQATLTELLLSRGANIEAKDSNGATAIEDSAGMGRLKMVALLAGAGADVNARASDGDTPLHLAAWNGHAEVVRLLLTLGADPSARNDAGETAYDVAARSDAKGSPSDKAEVLAALAPRRPPAPGGSEQTHGCPHTQEDLTWWYRSVQAASPKEKDPQVIGLAVQQTLRMLGCQGS